MARIVWTDTHYSGMDGSVNNLRRLFTITWKTRASDPDYVLRSTLPGFTSQVWKDDSPDALKLLAERVLERFVKELGAAFLG
ncbi:MAG TPA: hypothetical protein VFU47_03465 [Armatimonadota bacterium]|nr:hypothetical protein [Armatimonadota bacterium]